MENQPAPRRSSATSSVLHYQPQVDVQTGGTVVGAEALLRWQHPEPRAGAAGRVHSAARGDRPDRAGRRVGAARPPASELRALADRRVTAAAHGGQHLAVASSMTPGLAETVVERHPRHVRAAGPENLELETHRERHSPARAYRRPSDDVLQAARRALGVHIAIDDFGTGYSSLSRTCSGSRSNTLKIDREFRARRRRATTTMPVRSSPPSSRMAQSLKLDVIAEGVETDAQRELPAAMQGCRLMQGYLFARPMTAEALTALLMGVPGAGARPAAHVAAPDRTH
ncbi:MAG: EAL domain-containing protein [Comamonadaceae bacterium]|nr:EAL domain-containing protein [Comamonadaceae bacterium]